MGLLQETQQKRRRPAMALMRRYGPQPVRALCCHVLELFLLLFSCQDFELLIGDSDFEMLTLDCNDFPLCACPAGL